MGTINYNIATNIKHYLNITLNKLSEFNKYNIKKKSRNIKNIIII